MKFKLSTAAILITVLSCFAIDLSLRNWEKTDRVIEHDVHSYYAYLPAKFIYHDLEERNGSYRWFEDNYHLFWPNYTPEGKKVEKMTMGLAMLYSPFFFAGHYTALAFDYPPDGFSLPYKVFLLLGAIFYLTIGLETLRRILQHFNFTDLTSAITILLIGVGTNLLCYSSHSATMPHVYNFTLVALFIWSTIKWYEKPSLFSSIKLGLLIGLLSLIRPTNGLIALVFVFYGITSFNELKSRLLLFMSQYKNLILLLIFAILVWVPQMMYWETTTGDLIYYSYNDEGFHFSKPRLLQGLLSFRKGWLIYTPLMIFSLIGILQMKGDRRKIQAATVIFMIINLYVIFSWWCWWYGGTFGQRSMIDYYALLAIPFAVFVEWMQSRPPVIKYSAIAVAGFFVWLNVFQTYQFEKGSLHYEAMTAKLYFKQFGKMEKIPDFDSYLDHPDYHMAKFGFKKVESHALEFSKIQLKAFNGKFVCADLKIANLIADRDVAAGWETFVLERFDDGRVALKAHDGHYIAAEINSKDKKLVFNRDQAQDWEKFVIVDAGGGKVALKAANGKFVSYDPTTLMFFATGDKIGEQQKFEKITK